MSASFDLSGAAHASILIPEYRARQQRTGAPARHTERQAKRLLHRFLPQFSDPKTERRYRDAHLEHRLVALKVTITAGVFISILFAALDLSTIHDPSLPLFHVRIIGTVTLLAFFVAASLRKRDRWVELLCFGAMITQIAVLTTMLALSSSAPPSYNQPTELWLALGRGFLCRVRRLRSSMVSCWRFVPSLPSLFLSQFCIPSHRPCFGSISPGWLRH